MKDILIIAHFTQSPAEKGNGRFSYIADRLSDEEHSVEIVSSSFSHRTKKPRDPEAEYDRPCGWKFTMVYEPGYKKNVTPERFYSHMIFARSLKKYLRARKKPDVIYCSVPSLDAAYTAAAYAAKNHIRFIIDIQDLWPEAFEMVFHVPVISKAVFFPIRKKADKIYAAADDIVAVSQTYLDRAAAVNRKNSHREVAFLGTSLAYFDSLREKYRFERKPEDEIWIAYAGTLGHSYDLTSVIDAIELLSTCWNEKLRFIVMGDGPKRDIFENRCLEKNVKAWFTGRLEYGRMVGLLCACDIAVNPITKGAAQSIINKHGDYAAAGLPVINTQECPEYCSLLDRYGFGFNCRPSCADDIALKLAVLVTNKEMRRQLGEAGRRFAADMFDRGLTYNGIIDLLK